MVVIVHEAIGENACIEAFNCLRDDSQQRLAVSAILEDGLTTVAA